jgi:hypothetical protein
MCLLLDLVEVAKSHLDINLAAAFSKILEDFRIADKVSLFGYLDRQIGLTATRFLVLLVTMHRQTM